MRRCCIPGVVLTCVFLAGLACETPVNNPPEAPSTPTGSSSGLVDSTYGFLSSALDPDKDSVALRFAWGDGDTSDWGSWVASGDPVRKAHSWKNEGTYEVSAQAKDQPGIESEWSGHRTVAIFFNRPPSTPEVPTGPTSGAKGTLYTFHTMTTDPDGDSICYRFDWGDGDTSEWSTWMDSGDTVSVQHLWTDTGAYEVRAQAMDLWNAVSGWSDPHRIAIEERTTAFPDSVIATVPVGPSPFSLGILPNGEYVYVCNRNGTVSVVRTRDNTVTATVQVGSGTAFCCAPNNDYVYVTDEQSRVHVIRTSDNTVVERIAVGAWPLGIATSPDGQYVYVGNRTGNSVSVIRTQDNTVVATVGCGGHPWGVTVSPDGQWVYTGNGATDDVTVIRTSDHTVVATIAVGRGPGDNAVTPDGAYLFQSCGYDGVAVVDLDSRAVEGYIPYRTCVQGIRFLPNGEYCYVADLFSDFLGVIRAADRSIAAEIDLGATPDHLAVHPSGNSVYVTCIGSDYIKVVGFRGKD